MTTFRELNTQIGQWNQLRTLDTGNKGAVSATDVREQVDADRDGALSDQELDTAGLAGSEVREQLRLKYADAAQTPEGYRMNLFTAPDINARVNVLTTQRDALAAEGSRDLASLSSSGDSRSILNIADANRDASLSVSELRALDRNTVTRLAQEMNVDDMQGRLDHLDDHLDALEAGGATPEQSALPPESSAGVFDMFARAQGRPSSEAIEAARQQDQASPPDSTALRQGLTGFLANAGNGPEVRSLINGLQSQGQLGQENLLYLNSILSSSGPETLKEVSQTLGSFLQGSEGMPAAQRGEMARDILHDLAFPADIDQGNRATCAAASIQMKLAQTNPGRYAAMATTLAEGRPFAFESGQQLQPNSTYQGDSSDNRSLSGKIVQNAMMDFGRRRGDELSQTGSSEFEPEASYSDNGDQIFYDSRFSADPAQGATLSPEQLSLAQNTPALAALPQADLEALGLGLLSSESRELEREVLGTQVNNVTTLAGDDVSAAATVDGIDRMLAQGQPVSLDIAISSQGQASHTVLVVARNEGTPPTYQFNSWGKRYEVTRDQLELLAVTARLAEPASSAVPTS